MKTRTAIVALAATGLIATVGGATAQAASRTPDRIVIVHSTLSQSNAVEAAREYLQLQAFSKQGLIQQLSSRYGDGYSMADARYAVDHIRVNWYQQAVRSAREYLRLQPFSRSGLIQQLSSRYGEGFTLAQARYAVNTVFG